MLRATTESPGFLEVGTGGFFKEQDPNVAVEELQEKWVDGSHVMYIGKTGGKEGKATLKSRLKQYFGFGAGKAVGHRGGRYIWQLSDSRSLVVCWKILHDEEPRDVEARMIQDFKREHNGQRPFANLQE
ncbi:hypothetical protein E5358_08090 [Palleniella muris]|uniref:Uncharacterized protein n=1 Tax=Palleniella muris TaxID=3038145 RepID=A0AC61QPY8_9BACT|nr:hypothetical protein [Palleniella muris]TGX82250.1 hypothetical protein E5358_08090 [Palleniella muris]